VIAIPAGCSSYPVLTHDFTANTITNETGASLTLNGGDLTLTGDFICAGAFTCRGSETWTLPGTVDFTGATVSPGTSLGVLNAAGAQRVTTAGKSFFDLCLLAPSYTLLGGFDAHEVTCDQNAAVSLTFGAGDLFKATKFKMIVGTGSISLASTSPGTYWRLAAGTGSVFEGVTVNDSDASWGDPVCTVSYTGDHNLNWRKGASVWTGAEDTAWTNSNNWTGSVPDADSDVFVQDGTSQPTLSAETTVRSLRIGDGASSATLTVRAALTVREGLAVATNGTLVADAPITVTNDVTLSAGAKMTHTAGDSTGNAYRLDVTTFGDFTLDAAAGIDVMNRGYANAKGPGGANGSCSAASYASIGGYFDRSTLGTGIYGSVRRPDQCGSGGDSGAGGGAVRLRVAGTLALNGTVNANASRNGYGGGTGGSVWLTAGTIRGTGRVTAVCVCTGTCSFPSGGRVSLVQTAATDWTAFTGTVAVGPDASTRPGTVYRETAADRPAEGELEISGLSGNTMSATEPVKLTAAVTDAGEPFGRVTVKQYGRLTVDDGVTLRVTEALNAGGSSFTTAGDGAVELRPPAGETLDLSGGTLKIKHLVVTNAGSTVSVAKDTVVTNLANGTVTLKGTDDAPLVLTGPNGAWKLSVDANAVQSVAYVDVSNCNSLAGAAVTDLWGNDLGGTKNWMFTRPVEAGARLTWTGAAGTTSWIEGGNWEDDKGRSRPPMETDVFVIPAGCEVYPVIVDNFTANTISNQANASLTLGNNCKLTVTGDFICAGAFVCNGSEAWSVAGTVDFTGATVTPRTSTGTLNATSGVQTVTTAGKTFYDLVLAAPVMKLLGGLVAHKVTCDQNDAVALSFEAQKLFKADQFQVLVGTGSVALESTVPRTQWRLSAGLGSIFDGVSVSDSDASYGESVRTISFTDRGNNVNWFTGVRRWTGAEDADWANAANWEGGVPGSGSDVVVQEGATTPVISAATGVRSLVVGGGTSSAALTVRAPLSVGMDMVLLSGGTLTADAPIVVSNNVQLGVGSKVTHTAGGSYRVDITALGDIAIDAGASVDVLNRGYGTEKGPGGANGYCSAASYVSIGGYFDRSTLGTGVYGSFRRPDQCGSGGDLGVGGGAVHLCAGGTLTLNGTVDANSSANGYGGGTGGSVWFEAGTICGSGTVTALHVGTEVSSYPSGGRVSFVQRTATDWTAFTGTVNVGPSARSRVGSFYRETAADRPGEGTLEVVGCSGTSMEATEPVRVTAGITDGGETFGRVTVKGYGRLYVETGATVRVSSALTMAGSSWDCPGALEFCPHPGEQLAVTGTFTCSELVCTSALGTVSFAPGARVTVGTGGRQVKLRGDIGRRLTLKSATEGEAWYVSVSNDVPTDLRYLTVSDSDASGGKTMVTKSSGDRKGRNVNWELSAPGTVIVVK